MDRLYAVAGFLLAPFLPLWLLWRCLIGKEEFARLGERLGYASATRPPGLLMWIHAASVGEAMSVLPLIHEWRARLPHIHVLLSTGTRTSAALMKKRLPAGVIHQYAPLDAKGAVERFMRHWQPDAGLLVESELWPNLIAAADRWQCFLGIINGRMSERSFRFWQRHPALMLRMLGCLNFVFAQSQADGRRFSTLGARRVLCVGNMKYDGAPLPCDESALLALKTAIGARPVWLAASTHAGEEELIAKVHAMLSVVRPDLLTIIVPRHPERGSAIAAALSSRLRLGLRSRGDAIVPLLQCYIADTLGELGLFYRLSEIAFMGGSLVKRGGQNPLEAARLSCAILTGPHTNNFHDICREMEQANACLRVRHADDLAAQVGILLGNAARRQAMSAAAREWVGGKAGATSIIVGELAALFGREAAV